MTDLVPVHALVERVGGDVPVPRFGPAPTLVPLRFAVPALLDMTIYQGDTLRFRMLVKDTSGAPVDVFDLLMYGAVRKSVAELPTVPPLVTFTFEQNELNEIIIELTAANTKKLAAGQYVYDVQGTAAAENRVTTFLYGSITVTADVSHPP